MSVNKDKQVQQKVVYRIYLSEFWGSTSTPRGSEHRTPLKCSPETGVTSKDLGDSFPKEAFHVEHIPVKFRPKSLEHA